MGCGVYWQKVRLADKTLAGMREFGIPETDPVYQHIWHERGKLLGVVGQKFPRTTSILTETDMLLRMEEIGIGYAGASPGFTIEELKDAILKIWWDDESGFMAEARFRPGSTPIYHSLPNEDAFLFLTKQETPALIARAFTEDEYYGE